MLGLIIRGAATQTRSTQPRLTTSGGMDHLDHRQVRCRACSMGCRSWVDNILPPATMAGRRHGAGSQQRACDETAGISTQRGVTSMGASQGA